MVKATSLGSDLYSVDWTGHNPLSTNVTISGMSAAILAFTAAMGPPGTHETLPAATGAQAPSTSEFPSEPYSFKLSHGAIIGIAFGCVLIFVLVGGFIVLRLRQRRRRADTTVPDPWLPSLPKSGVDSQILSLNLDEKVRLLMLRSDYDLKQSWSVRAPYNLLLGQVAYCNSLTQKPRLFGEINFQP